MIIWDLVMKNDLGKVFPYINEILVPISVQEVGLKGPKGPKNALVFPSTLPSFDKTEYLDCSLRFTSFCQVR